MNSEKFKTAKKLRLKIKSPLFFISRKVLSISSLFT